MKQFIITLICLISLIFSIEDAKCRDYPLNIDVYAIKFNYQSGQSYDALLIKKNNSTGIPVPEWRISPPMSEKFAYIKGQSSRKIQVSFEYYARYNPLYIWAEAYGDDFGNVRGQEVDFDEFYPPTEHYLTFQTNGTVPGTVGKRSFYWKWYAEYEVSDPYGGEPEIIEVWIGDTQHEYYTLLAAPQSPMTVPWTDVLDYACNWANGQSSTSSALVELTEELYSCGVQYDGGTHYTVGSYTNLNLTLLLSHLSNPSIREMDCRDFSNFLHVLLNSLGGNCMYNRIDRTTNPYYFIYNYLWPAGWGNKASPNGWNYHQVGWYNSKVADASTKIDNDADPASSPHLWKLVTGDMTQSAYIDKLTDTPDVTSVATGTCTVY